MTAEAGGQRTYDNLGPLRRSTQNIQTSETAQAVGAMVKQNENAESLPAVTWQRRWPRPRPIR